MAGEWWKNDRLADPAPRAAKPKVPAAENWWEADPVAAPRNGGPATPRRSAPAAGGVLAPTGAVHDGDTFGVRGGGNARLYGVDAFELSQTGTTRGGVTLPLGREARDALAPFAQPDALATATGAETYGRPVASLSRGGDDAATSILRSGYGIATPEYLKADPARLPTYMEAERDARLNRRGAWAGSFEQPASVRHGTPDPWAKPVAGKPGESEAVFWDEPLPAQGLRPEIADRYIAIWQDRASKPDDLLAFAKASGFSIDPDEVRKNYAQRDKGAQAAGTVRYRTPPRVLTDPGDGAGGAAIRGFADPINVLDEAGALANTLLPGDRESLWNSDRRFGDVYANNLDQNRSILAYDDANHPWARFGGQLVGGVAMPGLSVEGAGLSAARSALRAGGTRFAAEQAARGAVVRRLGAAGAIEGAAAGIGQGEDWQERATGALIGAPVGLALGVGTGIAAPKLAQLVGRPFSKLGGTEGERAASDFTDGALDSARARASNEATDPVPSISGPVARSADEPTLTTDEGSRADWWAIDPIAPEASDDLLRQPDRINVADRPLPLTADATAAQRAAQAERIEPGDVLPLPSNLVDGIEEADRIAAGRIAPVRAGNEMDALERRNIPSPRNATRTIPKRGPLDLVTWLRTEGGIRAQGAELEHYGIDNAARKGLDFAGGENRFGPLVANEGMTYDDAAARAWEAGFFPDHAERPSVAEFLDTLNATHTGRNRAFRNEDLPEVDAFEAARSRRMEVEAARQDGDPLYEDRSSPVDMADLDNASAPVSAYEEWGDAAPQMAGNIRLDKLDSPQSIARALAQTNQRVGGFDAATRGRITQEETKRLAGELGMTADDLLKRRKGQAFNAEEALAARQILARSATDLVNMAKRVRGSDNPGDELEAAFKQVWLRHVAIQEQVSGATAEAGRALAAFRVVADARAVDRVLPSLGDIAGGTERLRHAADMIVDNSADAASLNTAAARALKPRFRDMVTELYYNSLLSGPATHAVNILSNTLTSLGQIPEHAVAAGLGAARRAAGRGDDRVLFGELGARAVGLMQGTREGLRQAARTFATGDAADAVTKMEQQTMRAIPGPVGSVLRTPTRALAAEDELFKAMARRMELAGLAVRGANKEGLTGSEAKARAAELLANPTDEMLSRSFDYGRYLTFQNPVGPVARKVSSITEDMPLLKLVLPFVRTPTNILKFAIERSPGAPILKEWRRDIAAGGAKRDLALAKVLVGSGIGATIYQMANDGQITGSGPADAGARRLLLANGWQPYSFKVGDRYYSYSRLDPYSTILGTAADLVDLRRHMTDKQQEHSTMLVGAAILNNLSSKTFLSGLSTALEAVNDPDRHLEGFTTRTLAGIATPSVSAQIARATDPLIREARDPISRILSRVPGQSASLPVRRDVFGRAVENQGGVGPDILSPIATSTGRNDPTVDALLNAGVHIGMPARKDMTPAEYSDFSGRAGALMKPQIDALARGPEWRSMTDDDRQDAVTRIVTKARRQARAGAATPWTPPASDRIVAPAPR